MLIGELSVRCGLSRDTIRFYEKKGLIAVGRKERRFNNYKEYSEKTLQRLMSIKLIKSLGFTLSEVSEVLDMIDMNEATCNNMGEKIEDKVRRIDEKIRELIKVRTLMLQTLNGCTGPACKPETAEGNCPMVIAQAR